MPGSWYNGYSPRERDAKYAALMASIQKGEIPSATGPCQLCGDPNAVVAYHSEDYSAPFRWLPPAMFALCRHCHLAKLHKRFSQPESWYAFLAHVRRGGYASELRDAAIHKEVELYKTAVRVGRQAILGALRTYGASVGSEWFASLRMDDASKQDVHARPRP